MPGFDSRELRNACGSFATGVTVISTTTEDGDHGMTANGFMSVSLEPPLITISLDHKCKMLERIRQSGRYAVNILAHDMEHVAMHFAGRHNPELAELFEHKESHPVVPGASAVFMTEVEREVEVGDHSLFIGRVTHIHHDPASRPLVFHGGKFSALHQEG